MKLPGYVLNETIKDLDGKPFQRPTSQTSSEPITVRYALRFALTSPEVGADGRPAQEDPDRKYELYELARKVYNHDTNTNLELSTKEITLLQEKARKTWNVEVYGFLYELLEGKLDYPPMIGQEPV